LSVHGLKLTTRPISPSHTHTHTSTILLTSLDLRFIHRTTTFTRLNHKSRLFPPFVVTKKRAYTGAQHYKKFGHHGAGYLLLLFWLLGEAHNRNSLGYGAKDTVYHTSIHIWGILLLFCFGGVFFFGVQSIASGRPEAMGLWIGKFGLEMA